MPIMYALILRFKRMARKLYSFFGKGEGMNYNVLDFDPTSYSQDERIRFLEAKVAFLLDEVSDMRSRLRYLVAEKRDDLPIFQQTKDSFNFQWDRLPEGYQLLSSETWKNEVVDTMCKYSNLPAEWFRGKKVMDAGCGRGRWTYGFGKLGVGSCTSFDISENGIDATKSVAGEFGDHFTVCKRNILDALDFADDYDMVWCYGVLHHTGDTYGGFHNLIRHVKPGGYFFFMLYGEPRPPALGEYVYYHEICDMRRRTRNLTFDEKAKILEAKYEKEYVHGYFDAISPEINDLYRWDEIVGWLINAGFVDIKRTLPDHPNHHVIALKRDR